MKGWWAVLLILLVGCGTKIDTFDKEGMYFVPPTGFTLTDQQTDRFAFTDRYENAILFVVNKEPISNSLLDLGQEMAKQDLATSALTADEVDSQVRIMEMGTQTWYTYAVDFPDKRIKSIVMGTLCGDNEITSVMVTQEGSYEENRVHYLTMIGTFRCR